MDMEMYIFRADLEVPGRRKMRYLDGVGMVNLRRSDQVLPPMSGEIQLSRADSETSGRWRMRSLSGAEVVDLSGALRYYHP